MAKQFIDLADLTLFKTLNDSATAAAIAEAEARSLHTVAIVGNTLKFYREEEPVGSATPAYSITLPETDLSNYLQKIASATGGKIVVSKADGTIEESSIAVADIKTVATTGAAADVTIADAEGLITATNVEDALAELAAASAGGVASKTVYLQDESAGQSDYAKVYKLYQGADSSDMTKDVLVGTINIPKDLVVQRGKVVTVKDSIDSDGDSTTVADGTYIKLLIQNQTAPLYINVADLIDVYTAQQNASQVQIAISDANVISATIVAGSITATELASNAVTTAKIEDDAVTADKVAIAAHTESADQLGRTDGLSVSVTTTDGQVSSVTASIAAETYDAYGAAEDAKSDVVGTTGDTSDSLTIYGVKAYADEVAGDATEAVPEADIRALFAN